MQPTKCGLKLNVVLKWRDIYIETIRVVPLLTSLKMMGIVKHRGLKSQAPLYTKYMHNSKFSAPEIYKHNTLAYHF